MMSDNEIKKQMQFTLKETNISGLGDRKKGKVRDVYVKDDKLFLIATDRQSAFDRNLANIPFKGQVLTQTSLFWFENTKDILAFFWLQYFVLVKSEGKIICIK